MQGDAILPGKGERGLLRNTQLITRIKNSFKPKKKKTPAKNPSNPKITTILQQMEPPPKILSPINSPERDVPEPILCDPIMQALSAAGLPTLFNYEIEIDDVNRKKTQNSIILTLLTVTSTFPQTPNPIAPPPPILDMTGKPGQTWVTPKRAPLE